MLSLQQIEAVTFYHFLSSGSLITHLEIQELFKEDQEKVADTSDENPRNDSDLRVSTLLWIPASRYVLGCSDLSGEIMRFSTNNAGAQMNGKDVITVCLDFLRTLSNGEYRPRYLVVSSFIWLFSLFVDCVTSLRSRSIYLFSQGHGEETSCYWTVFEKDWSLWVFQKICFLFCHLSSGLIFRLTSSSPSSQWRQLSRSDHQNSRMKMKKWWRRW